MWKRQSRITSICDSSGNESAEAGGLKAAGTETHQVANIKRLRYVLPNQMATLRRTEIFEGVLKWIREQYFISDTRARSNSSRL